MLWTSTSHFDTFWVCLKIWIPHLASMFIIISIFQVDKFRVLGLKWTGLKPFPGGAINWGNGVLGTFGPWGAVWDILGLQSRSWSISLLQIHTHSLSHDCAPNMSSRHSICLRPWIGHRRALFGHSLIALYLWYQGYCWVLLGVEYINCCLELQEAT